MARMSALVLVIVASAAVVATLLLVPGQSPGVRATASSGSGASDLARGAGAWRTDTESIGAWIELSYPRPTRVDHVDVLGPEDKSAGFTSAVLTFDGGGSLMVTADDSGDAAVTFPARTTSRVRLTIAEVPRGATSVALAGLSVDGSGSRLRGDDGGRPTARASSTAGSPASALSDGRPAEGETGAEWRAAPDDPAPWAELSWDRPHEISAVQVFGPTSTARDGSTAPLHGLLRFGDGSTVVVSGIAGGNGAATTIALTPRMATSVRLEIQRTVPDAAVGLREFAAYDAGTTPPRWPQEGPRYAAHLPPAGQCDASSAPVAEPAPGRLTLVCPSPGSAVGRRTSIVVAADPGTPLEALTWTGRSGAGPGSVAVVASATAGADGRATLQVDTSRTPRGPLTLRVQEAGGDPDRSLYVQLVHRGGRQVRSTGSAPAGMTLQWAEEFTGPVSISRTGAGAEYAATKPDASSSGQFGEARFADPASGAGTVATVDGDYLRIRARPAGDGTGEPAGSGHVAGLLASADDGGAGFAAQYGYFEARMMGAPGPGAWPAFWMLDTESAARASDTAGEVDAVELYGANTMGSCHTLHSWGAAAPAAPDGDGQPSCQDENGFADWALAWHTYGVRITPDGATFSIDGQQVASPRGLSHSAEPFFFLVDLALGGGWPVDLGPTGGITDMYVDWVHVYT